MPELDSIFIVDTMREKAEEAQSVVERRAEMTDVLVIDLNKREKGRAEFSDKINKALRTRQRVMVVFDACSGVKGGVIEELRGAEEFHGLGTRRILFSCHSRGTIDRGFAERGIPREGIRHVVYRSQDPQRWMEEMDGLFRPRLVK